MNAYHTLLGSGSQHLRHSVHASSNRSQHTYHNIDRLNKYSIRALQHCVSVLRVEVRSCTYIHCIACTLHMDYTHTDNQYFPNSCIYIQVQWITVFTMGLNQSRHDIR